MTKLIKVEVLESIDLGDCYEKGRDIPILHKRNTYVNPSLIVSVEPCIFSDDPHTCEVTLSDGSYMQIGEGVADFMKRIEEL